MVDLRDALEGRFVLAVGARGDHVDDAVHVGVVRVVLLHVERLVVREPRVLGMRAVEESDGDGGIAHGGGGQRRFHLHELKVHRVLLDVRDGRQLRHVGLELDKPGRLHHAQRARLVDDVVHDGHAVAFLDLLHRSVLLRVDAQRGDQRVADGNQLHAVLLGPVVHEVVVLKRVQVHVAVRERLVGDDVVRELHQLDFDALFLQRGDDDLLPLFVVLAHDADLDLGDVSCQAGHGRKAQDEREQRRKNPFHGEFLLLDWGYIRNAPWRSTCV